VGAVREWELRYIKPALIDLGVLDYVVVIGPHDHDQPQHDIEHEGAHEVEDAGDEAGRAER
jgi:hypothetical protein